MAETKTESKNRIEREYVIPLRNEWRKTSYFKRTGRAIRTIKRFIARHMKVPERNLDKVKLDIYLNQEIWFRGRKSPPAKIKVKAIKEGDIVKVELADIPEHVKFLKQKSEKKQKRLDKSKPEAPKTEKKDEKADKEAEKEDEDKKKDEKEKEKSVAQLRAVEAKQDAKAQKHSTKGKEPIIHRMALKK